MRRFLKKIVYFNIHIKVKILKLRAKFWGYYSINKYIRSCSPITIKQVLKLLGVNIDMSASLRDGLSIENSYFNYDKLTIGENTYIGRNVGLDLSNKIEIKKDAVLSEGVILLTHADVGDRMMKEFYPRKDGNIIIDEGCWLGANAVVLCGTHLGKCSVVAAGSVVTKDIEPYTVVGGVPAKVIKKLK